MSSASERPRIVPHLPFLAFAPLDTWWLLLNRPKARIPRRYLLRVVFGLVVSGIITLLTLPERLLVGLWLVLGGRSQRLPGPVIILGYYRSGTTHLQFLLSRDPNLQSPRWTQTLSPQGFAVSWSLLNWFLLPLFPDKRPQDNAAFGSDIPAEDDFALANAALASSLIGRHVLPELRDHYDRYHDLTRLTPEEYSRWRRAQEDFVRKIGLLAGKRRVLLKTPSHTARVEQLMALFDDVRFIHISRKPDAVFRSNVGLHRVLNDRYHLQDPLPDEQIERRIVEEYLATEQNYLAAKEKIPASRLTELRMEDLMADPVGQIQRMYADLGLEYSDNFEQQLLEYLDASKTYEPNVHKEKGAEESRMLEPLAPLKVTFGHDHPAVAKQEPPPPRSLQAGERRGRLIRGAVEALFVVALAIFLAVGLTRMLGIRLDGLGWLAGIAGGTAAITVARRGSVGLGLWSAAVTLCGQLVLALVTTWVLSEEALTFGLLLKDTFATLQTPFILFWFVLGTLGAYRLATRRWI